MERIIVGVDGSAASQAAIDWALRYAQPDDTVVFSHSWHIPSTGGLDLAFVDYDRLDEAARRLVAGLVEAHQDEAGPQIEGSVEQGHAGSCLIRSAETADLLVVGRRGLGGFKGLLLGSVSTYVVHHAECPVVVVNDPAST